VSSKAGEVQRAYHRATSFNVRDFLFRLTYLHNDSIKYLQIDNGSEWEKYFIKEVEKRKITLVYNYPKSPKMNTFVERVKKYGPDRISR
jgi:hypothetical protein